MPRALLTGLALLALSSTARAQRAALEVALRHETVVDETLSPLRYSGPVLVARIAASLTRGSLEIVGDADLAAATFDVNAGIGGHPAMRELSSLLSLGAERRWRTLGGFAVVPGLHLIGRAAAREHDFTIAQSGGRYPGLTQSSGDDALALAPAVRVSRVSAGGRMIDVALHAAVFGIARHTYAAGRGDDSAPWSSGGPGRLLMAEGAAGWRRPLGHHATVGARYSVRVLRVGGASRVAGVSHQLGATIGWGPR